MTNPFKCSRRELLRVAASAPWQTKAGRCLTWAVGVEVSAPASLVHAQPVATVPLTVFYQRSAQGPSRLEPIVQAASAALQGEFANRGYRVVEPSADVYQGLDKGPEVMVSFAPDAGFSMLYWAHRNVRPMVGQDKATTEVVLHCRVFVGHNLVAAENATGAVVTHMEANVRDWGELRGAEVAAQRAAAVLAGKVQARLSVLSRQRIDELSRLSLPTQPGFQSVPVPPQTSTSVLPLQTIQSGPLPKPARKFALLVTVSDYSQLSKALGTKIKNLSAVEIDKRKLLAALKAQGFAPENIRVLSDAQATSSAVLAELGRLAKETQPDDLVLIAFSAHGVDGNEVPSGFGKPVLIDYRPNDPGAFDFWHLQSLVGNLPARQTVLLLDTCHSGGATGMMNTVTLSPQGVTVQKGSRNADASRMAEVQGRNGRAFAVITAANADEVSWELSGSGGLFTSAFVDGLRQASGQMTLADIFKQYVVPRVVEGSSEICRQGNKCNGKLQNPQMATSGQGGEIRI